VDVNAAAQRGIWTTNVEDYGMDEVSSHALALILACAKGLIAQTVSVRSGGWNPMLNKPQKRISESTVGVIGVGRIGTRSVQKCKGAGFRVVAHDPFVADEVIRAAGAEPMTRAQLFAESDYITLHTPLNDGTRGMIDAACFAEMKRGMYLINCSRGPVVNEQALLDALNSGHLRGAALDVLVEEPPKAGTSLALVQHPNVIATPHSAFYTEQAIDFMWQSAAREVVAVLTGKTPRCPVNRPVFK
jgi:D-3-phosphoglycerate dehydrogenase